MSGDLQYPVRTSGARGLHVVMVAYGFPPLRHSGTIRSEAFAHYLPEYGVQTTVLTHDGGASAHRRSSMAVAQDDNWADDDQRYEIRRVDWRLGPRTSRISALLNRIPLGSSLVRASRRSEFLKSTPSLTDRIIDWNRVNVIYGSGAPPEALLLARQLAQRHQLPLVLDLRDPWSYQPPMPYRHFLDFLTERRLERQTLADADAVLVTTQTTARLLKEKLGVPAKRIHVITNGYDERDFGELEDSQPPADHFVVTHAGQMGVQNEPTQSTRRRIKSLLGFDFFPLNTDSRTRSPRYILAGAAEFLRAVPEAREKFLIQLIGLTNVHECSSIAEFPFPECLRITERVSSADAVAACRRSQLLIVMQNRYFLDGEEYCVAIPAKLYTYLRTGRRILACVPESEISELVVNLDAGICVRPDDATEICKALSREYHTWAAGSEPRTSPRVDQYSRYHLTGELANVLTDVVARHTI